MRLEGSVKCSQALRPFFITAVELLSEWSVSLISHVFEAMFYGFAMLICKEVQIYSFYTYMG